MTENELRAAVVAQARSWLGCNEYDGSHRQIIDLYNRYRRPGDYCMTYTDPWCAADVSAVGMAVSVANGLPGQPYELIPSSAACDPMISQYIAMGRWIEDDSYLPSPGDVIFYDWQDTGYGDNTGSSDHVGIVTDVDKVTGDITVIEGNKSDSVCYRSIRRNGRYIRGYGLPDYERYADGTPGEGEIITPDDPHEGDVVIIVDPPEPTPAPGLNLPMLRQGDKGEVVRAAQFLLNGRGCSVGCWGADGEFGPQTRAAVLAFQRRNSLEPDGIIGPKTWAKLLGIN